MANELNERDTRIVAWLNEAYAKEAELEADLTAHIGLTQKASYKKRLQAHLKETREHKRTVARRIKALGGAPSEGPEIPLVPTAVGELAGKTVAAVKGQIGATRALLTEQAETHVRNAQEELREEHVEIAIYTRIETFATEVGDNETAKLARAIIRDEERMAKFLSAELTRLVKELVKSEIPRDQRPTRTTTRRRTTTRSASGSAASSSRSAASSSRSSGSSSRSSGSSSRSAGSGSRSSGSTSGRSAASSGRSSSSGSTTRRTTSRRSASSGQTSRRSSARSS